MDGAGIEITPAHAVDDELVEAFARLVPQLSSSPPPTAAALREIVDSPSSVLLLARDTRRGGAIVGTLTLVVYRIPTGGRACIEDVVVDGSARGRGVGEALCREAIERARGAGAENVQLTSRPAREAANRLYQRLGFQRRETNAYVYPLVRR
jgi:ribosomal protein S18 acetylase RimI-like enzyme